MSQKTQSQQQRGTGTVNTTAYDKDYNVILLNDNFTTMEFVTEILVEIFHKTVEQATEIMLTVHKKGKGVAGTYSEDIAITKATAVTRRARENGFPLKCVIEEA